MISDHQVEVWISVLLRTGVLLAALVVFSGGILYLVHHEYEHPNYRTFHGAQLELRQPSLIFHGAISGNARSLIQLGLMLLILTPVARVAFSVVAFAAERDRMYVVMTLIVLAVLLYSLMSG
jgi:uncharacterized membrane protein